jgi:glycosyltransferase involved in cell wall biosynthesis
LHTKPLVSIVAINYNNEKWVLETLNSIAEQTYDNIELIIVDDCSTDQSPQLIAKWLETYSKPASFIRHSQNRGICATSNTGFKNAKGDYVCYIATDDVMIPEKTEQELLVLENSSDDVAMVYCDAYLISDDSSPLYGWFIQRHRNDYNWPPSGNIFDELAKGNFIPAMSIMLKKKVLSEVGYFDESLVFEDFDMWLRIANKFKILYHTNPLVKYRLRKGSAIQTIKSWSPSFIKIYKKFQTNESVQRRLVEIAKSSYIQKDYESLDLLKTLDVQLPEILQVIRLRTLRVPYFLGKRIVNRL